MSDYDKQQWQAEQEAKDAVLEKQRLKDEKAKARKAQNAQRKIERLRAKLKESGELTEWEDEFSESVAERLDKYGSAFHDLEKGRRSDALSYAQKKVVSALNKKAKGDKTKSGFKNRGGFKSKKGFTPRVRDLDDDMPEKTEDAEVFIPTYTPPEKPKKPFLRIVSNDDHG